jgi:hypothetical protein
VGLVRKHPLPDALAKGLDKPILADRRERVLELGRRGK